MNPFIYSVYCFFYALPTHTTVTLLALLYIGWPWLKQSLRPRCKTWKWICFSGLLLWLFVVFYITWFARETGEAGFYLMPFQQMRDLLNGANIELLRSAWMNVLLFIPGGLFFNEVLPQKCPTWLRGVLVISLLAGISAGIEAGQWYWQIGRAETDDVLCNAAGAMLGWFISLHRW